jgi:hypothetical protein
MRLYAARRYPKTRLSVGQLPDHRTSDFVTDTALDR